MKNSSLFDSIGDSFAVMVFSCILDFLFIYVCYTQSKDLEKYVDLLVTCLRVYFRCVHNTCPNLYILLVCPGPVMCGDGSCSDDLFGMQMACKFDSKLKNLDYILVIETANSIASMVPISCIFTELSRK